MKELLMDFKFKTELFDNFQTRLKIFVSEFYAKNFNLKLHCHHNYFC